MDEKAITRAAQAAVSDLQLDCRVDSVFKRQDKWCIKFTDAYGQFCNEFRSESGQENSARVIREKIKSFLFKVRKPGRDRRARSSFATNTGQEKSGLMETPLEVVGDVLDRTSSLIGGFINQVSNMAGTALPTEAAVNVDLPSAANTGTTRQRKTNKKAEEPSVKIPVRVTSNKTGRKSSPRAGKLTATASKKAAQKRTSKKTGPKAAKAKKAARKRARKKS